MALMVSQLGPALGCSAKKRTMSSTVDSKHSMVSFGVLLDFMSSHKGSVATLLQSAVNTLSEVSIFASAPLCFVYRSLSEALAARRPGRYCNVKNKQATLCFNTRSNVLMRALWEHSTAAQRSALFARHGPNARTCVRGLSPVRGLIKGPIGR
jgi:hypothetical protein